MTQDPIKQAQDVVNILTRQRETALDGQITLGLQLIDLETRAKAAEAERDKLKAQLAAARKKLRKVKG